MLAISSGNALVMHTYTLFTPLQFFILCECLKLYFYVPFWPACPPTLYQTPWDWIIIMYFNARSTQGVIFFNDRCISLCWTLSYLANEVILMVCNER